MESAPEGTQLFENTGWAPCRAFVTGDTAHGGAPPRDGYVSVLIISVFLTPIKTPFGVCVSGVLIPKLQSLVPTHCGLLMKFSKLKLTKF